MAEITTLVPDIMSLFNPDEGHEVNEDNLQKFLSTLGGVIKTRLAERDKEAKPLRFSSLGRPDRQIWYASRGAGENLSSQTYLKFLYGDVIEALLLFLAAEAGHTVEREQEEVSVDGVKGHIDAVIDGVVVDVKSASPFGFKKFKTGEILTGDDPFGYVAQLAGYASVLTPDEPAAWFAMDKVGGGLCVSPLPGALVKDNEPAPRIEHLKEVVKAEEPPPRCYEDIPDGKSGNRKLAVGCSYCAFKRECWPELRTFIYSTGPRYLTVTKNTPDVPEVRVEEVIEDS